MVQRLSTKFKAFVLLILAGATIQPYNNWSMLSPKMFTSVQMPNTAASRVDQFFPIASITGDSSTRWNLWQALTRWMTSR